MKLLLALVILSTAGCYKATDPKTNTQTNAAPTEKKTLRWGPYSWYEYPQPEPPPPPTPIIDHHSD
jgi:hypothetical protein